MKTVQQIMEETGAKANIENFRYMQEHYTYKQKIRHAANVARSYEDATTLAKARYAVRRLPYSADRTSYSLPLIWAYPCRKNMGRLSAMQMVPCTRRLHSAQGAPCAVSASTWRNARTALIVCENPTQRSGSSGCVTSAAMRKAIGMAGDAY